MVEYTIKIISDYYKNILISQKGKTFPKLLICGGGRKNSFLVKRLRLDINKYHEEFNKNETIKLIDEYGIDGDFVESQAFAYLAVRSMLGLPISYPETTGCLKPVSGGVIFDF